MKRMSQTPKSGPKRETFAHMYRCSTVSRSRHTISELACVFKGDMDLEGGDVLTVAVEENVELAEG